MTELRNLRVLVVDDNVFRSVDIKRALEFNGVHRIALVDNQAAVQRSFL